MINNNNNK